MKPDYETLASQTVLLPTYQSLDEASHLSRLKERLSSLKGRFSIYYQNYTTRRQLLSLSAERLRDAANEKNIDGSTLEFFDVTLNCVRCHKYVRKSHPELKQK